MFSLNSHFYSMFLFLSRLHQVNINSIVSTFMFFLYVCFNLSTLTSYSYFCFIVTTFSLFCLFSSLYHLLISLFYTRTVKIGQPICGEFQCFSSFSSLSLSLSLSFSLSLSLSFSLSLSLSLSFSLSLSLSLFKCKPLFDGHI